MIESYTTAIFIFILGAMLGSFINVLIHRMPRQMPATFARSQCPSCNQTILWYDNIPLISYIILNAKCRKCHKRISPRYFVVELFLGLTTLYLFPEKISTTALITFLFSITVLYTFTAIFFIDLDFKIIPNELNIYLGIVFFIFSFFHYHFYHMALGFLLGGGLPLLISWLFYCWKGQIGLGGGDIKLFAVLGIYLGPIEVMRTLFLSCFLGSLIFLILMGFKKANRKTKIPFGPCIVSISFIQICLPNIYHRILGFIVMF